MLRSCPPSLREKAWIHQGNGLECACAHLTYGLRSGIPLCCALNFALSHLWQPHQEAKEWWDRDTCIYGCEYAHCGLHRFLLHPYPPLPLSDWLRQLEWEEEDVDRRRK